MDLVADIGATNARFQYCDSGMLVDAPLVLKTTRFDAASDLLCAAMAELGPADIDSALLAIAGPVNDEQTSREIQVTNTGLRFSDQYCAAVLGCSTYLANDFYALAHGVPYFSSLVQIGGDDVVKGTKALLGPGSGLGMATLVPDRDGHWQVLASEGGHADLAPGSHLEAELWGLLMTDLGHVSWESVLCGAGLQQLYTTMCTLWGASPEALSPQQISARGMTMADPVCHQTLETFCGLLGAAAGNLALTVAAVGGVYIGGGIVPQMLEFVQSSPLRRRFEERGALSGYVEAIPLFVITEDNPGLQGAAHCLNNIYPN